MWIFTTFGFFSVVEHRSDRSLLMVRGRWQEQMTCLSRALLAHNSGKAITEMVTPEGDYPYRITVKRTVFAKFMANLLLTTPSYTNFKSAVAKQAEGSPYPGDRAYLEGLHNVWAAMREVEPSRMPGVKKASSRQGRGRAAQ